MIIRDLNPGDDIPELVKMEREIFAAEAWGPADFRTFLRQGGQFRVGEHDGRIVGYTMYMVEYDCFHICNLCVIAELQGNGPAHELFEDMLSAAKSSGKNRAMLEVARSNARAIRFYLRHGFTQFGTRRRYYHNGDDALLMERPITA